MDCEVLDGWKHDGGYRIAMRFIDRVHCAVFLLLNFIRMNRVQGSAGRMLSCKCNRNQLRPNRQWAAIDCRAACGQALCSVEEDRRTRGRREAALGEGAAMLD